MKLTVQIYGGNQASKRKKMVRRFIKAPNIWKFLVFQHISFNLVK